MFKAILEHLSSQTSTIAAALAAVIALVMKGGDTAAGASPMPVPSN
jgi:hypothetical protein